MLYIAKVLLFPHFFLPQTPIFDHLVRIFILLEALDTWTMKESTMNCVKYLLFLLNLLISVSRNQKDKDILHFSSFFYFISINYLIFA